MEPNPDKNAGSGQRDNAVATSGEGAHAEARPCPVVSEEGSSSPDVRHNGEKGAGSKEAGAEMREERADSDMECSDAEAESGAGRRDEERDHAAYEEHDGEEGREGRERTANVNRVSASLAALYSAAPPAHSISADQLAIVRELLSRNIDENLKYMLLEQFINTHINSAAGIEQKRARDEVESLQKLLLTAEDDIAKLRTRVARAEKSASKRKTGQLRASCLRRDAQH